MIVHQFLIMQDIDFSCLIGASQQGQESDDVSTFSRWS